MEKADLYALDLAHVRWEKSSYSLANGDCVEVAHLPGGAVALRDSKNPHREALRFTSAEWSAFRRGIVAGEPED
ncbi:hypothetical protein AQI88_19475 [Streptomyces cellostaticus]|uniref:DUF397 domain-containing protein n=1 Tax=Streptomyces cellostaticus TaxID=67285 RepID=A0A101NKU1_9ACTN|nr:DUF397 domain-containing protein [Streptomyces cellostaticus]KUM95010.1 hypothetical protein AQI88_19475 [Streptomyces cellostaticus]GHI06530.1 DUF397 domain-containing protein [Streptomyces cellostaticus]